MIGLLLGIFETQIKNLIGKMHISSFHFFHSSPLKSKFRALCAKKKLSTGNIEYLDYSRLFSKTLRHISNTSKKKTKTSKFECEGTVCVFRYWSSIGLHGLISWPIKTISSKTIILFIATWATNFCHKYRFYFINDWRFRKHCVVCTRKNTVFALHLILNLC